MVSLFRSTVLTRYVRLLLSPAVRANEFSISFSTAFEILVPCKYQIIYEKHLVTENRNYFRSSERMASRETCHGRRHGIILDSRLSITPAERMRKREKYHQKYEVTSKTLAQREWHEFSSLCKMFACIYSETGWSNLSEDKGTKYRLTIKDIQQQESGTYTCASPRGLTNSIVIVVTSNLSSLFSPLTQQSAIFVFMVHRALF